MPVEIRCFLLSALQILTALETLSGSEYFVRSVSIVSNTRTRNFIIRQELNLSEGEKVSEEHLISAVSNCMQNLRNIGLFSELKVEYNTGTNTTAENTVPPVDIIITATDKWTFFPVPYYYYDNKDGHGFVFILEESNLFGLNQQIQLRANYVSVPDLKNISINYNYPRLFGSLYFIKFKLSYGDFLDSEFEGINTVYLARAFNYMNETCFGKIFPFGSKDLSIFMESELNIKTNIVIMNTIDKRPENLTAWYVGPGMEIGSINIDSGEFWGSKNTFRIGISPLNGQPRAEIILENFVRLRGKSDWGYKITAFASPGFEKPLDSGDVRGISLGEIRGSYLVYGNIEFRPYILKITWPTGMNFYTPLFIDFGNGAQSGNRLELQNTVYTLGAGLRFYPRDFGGNSAVIRLDAGIKPALLYRNNPADYLYMGFDFNDVF